MDRKKDAATLTVDPFVAFSARTRREVVAEGEALLRFAEPDARSFEVRVGDVRHGN
jgi:ferric-dicitrate binding protein FerR (iron transport regulator)